MDFGIGAYILLLIVIVTGVAITSLMCVFLLVLHEWGHISAMLKFGIKPELVVIGWPTAFKCKVNGVPHHFGWFPVFGYTQSAGLLTITTRKKAIIALAGPLTSLLLGLMLLPLAVVMQNWVIHLAGWGSLVIAVMNIVPLPPMDGWFIGKYLLEKKGIKLSENTERGLYVAGIAVACFSVFLLQEINFLDLLRITY